MRYTVKDKQWNDEKCFICGINNSAGVKAEFFNCIDEEGNEVLITEFKTQEIHQSYPGRTHGGVTSALLDESIGRAVYNKLPDVWAVTIDLTIKFRKTVPLNETLYIISKITDIGQRAFDGEGKMVDKYGTVLATGFARYFRVPLETAAINADFKGFTRHYLNDNLPEYIDIG